ncbi:SNW domain-containing protein 1-like [Carassius carassius]|uniref:SNW domain-containing protein 1-like n=1 Tax=Carassius carassius TaxID=217509 RepID=UPI0028684094|nr:SNW domain-containing protein 1-like [Carassius carassius]
MSLASFLPAPTQLSQDQLEAEERSRVQRSQSTALVSTRREPPPYGFRKSWVPRALEITNTQTFVSTLPCHFFIIKLASILLSEQQVGNIVIF